ncbi:hypothetical protein ACHAXA_000784 [Cyclostephanos tholiformis]|uniref:Calcium uniporter protein n=1 Tax=Cyclostephanos tholiformis TaxID=382380 RepID=A0ABD3R3E0_9STRA
MTPPVVPLVHHRRPVRIIRYPYSPPPGTFDVVPSLISEASSAIAVEDGGAASSFTPTYSNASYYTTLALYVASFPGLWSQIKRSTKAKVKRKTYVRTMRPVLWGAIPSKRFGAISTIHYSHISHIIDYINVIGVVHNTIILYTRKSPGEAAAEGGKELRQQAGEIMAYMKANNYEIAEAGETITFRGLVARSTSQAFFLTFCTAIGMASLALVLQIQLQDLVLPGIGSPNWFYLVLLSPYAGIYYWRSGDRVDEMKVKLATNDDETLNEVTIEGNDEEIERMWRTLDLREKGMVKVEGILG